MATLNESDSNPRDTGIVDSKALCLDGLTNDASGMTHGRWPHSRVPMLGTTRAEASPKLKAEEDPSDPLDCGLAIPPEESNDKYGAL